MQSPRFSIFLILILLLQACGGGNNGVDTSDVDVKFNAFDFYQDFRNFDTKDCNGSLSQLQSKYPKFLNFYLDTLLDIGSLPTNAELCENITMVMEHKDLKFLADTINIVYPNTENAQAEIEKLYKHIKYYLPEWKAPDVYFFDGGLKLWQVVSYQDYLAIGLDMFLGDDFPYYAARQVPMYMMPNFKTDQIPVQSAKVIYNDLFPFMDATAVDFLQLMIENGKRILFLDFMLPDIPIEDFFGIKKEQMDWLNNSEAGIYNFFVQKDMLYNTSMKDNMKYISPAPHSPMMPEQAPAQTGVFIGYKILQKYMEETGKSLVETLREKDYNQIFQRSKYKPH